LKFINKVNKKIKLENKIKIFFGLIYKKSYSGNPQFCEQRWRILRAGKNLGKIGNLLGKLA